jgi:hypothetical protein
VTPDPAHHESSQQLCVPCSSTSCSHLRNGSIAQIQAVAQHPMLLRKQQRHACTLLHKREETLLFNAASNSSRMNEGT